MPATSRQLSALIALVGSGLLFVSLFMEWYDPGVDAWRAFELLDLVLAGAAIFAFSTAAAALFGERWPARGRSLPAIGGAAALIVLSQIIQPPPLIPTDASVRTGAWLALVGALILSGGGDAPTAAPRRPRSDSP
jgi:hypothetical protein